jgi:hypothetical protein
MSHHRPAYQHIADDHHRRLLILHAVRKGIDQARGDFYHALLVDGLDDESLDLFAREVWEAYQRQVTFDYPQFAETLFLRAYRTSYRRHLEDVASGRHTDPQAVAQTIETVFGLGEP